MKMLKRLLNWLNDRSGLGDLIGPMAVHPVPPGARWKYVFGSATLAAFVLQVISGIGLATTYVSSTGGAYESLQFLTDKAPLGSLLRGMHYWGASAMVVMVFCHLLRVFLTGSYKFPRELNWMSGALLLGLTLALAFSGQILRWDQNAVWSLVVGAEQAGRVPLFGDWLAHFVMGGDVVGAYTLSRVFSVHVFVLPILLVGLVGLHLHLVLRNGVSEPPSPGRKVDPATYREEYHEMLRREGVPFWPEAAWRDSVFALLITIVVLLLALLVGPAQLDKPPDPSLINALPRPDWYFWWYFALLALLPHSLENYVMILFPLIAGLILFLIPLAANRGERHPARRPLAVGAVIFFASVFVSLTLAGWKVDWSPRFDASPLDAKTIGASSGSVYDGAMVFNDKGCLYCHSIAGHGGKRGPDLTWVADRLTRDELTLRILNGAYNMPVYGSILTTTETRDLLDFLASRKKQGFIVGKTGKAEE